MPIIEITGLVLAPKDGQRLYRTSRLAVSQGDVIVIVTEIPADGRHLLRVLTTLEQPEAGEYRFKGKAVNLKDYRQCLAVKRQLGYVAADAAMISNRTIRENLLLTRFYLENDLTIDIDATVSTLCAATGLTRKLDMRPSALGHGERLKAITIREMAKAPAVMLVERPENFIRLTENDGIFNHLKKMAQSETAMVFISHDPKMTALANRQLILTGGEIRTRSL